MRFSKLRRSSALRRWIDSGFSQSHHFCLPSTVAIVLVGIFLLCFQAPRRVKALRAAFLTTSSWNPVTGEYGALHAIYGTLVSCCWRC